MARYFFHLVSSAETSKDEIGVELANAEAAYLEACAAALEISFEMLSKRIDPSRHAFEVTDAEGQVVFEIPFSEVMHPGRRESPSAETEARRRRNHTRRSSST